MLRFFVSIIVLAVFTLASFSRNSYWQNDMTIWSDALEKSPAKVRGFNELGLYYINQREFEQAISVFLRSLAMDKYQATIYINLGIAYEGVQRYEDASRIYRMAMYFQPDDPVPYYNLGILTYNHLHDLRTALDLLLQARDRRPDEPDVHQYLGLVYRDLGDLKKSEEEFALNHAMK